jgi:DNA-binding response OmpR family regulator
VSGLNILVVEDHADTARVMRVLLTREGHRVEVAGTLEEAGKYCEEEDFDLVITDIELPDGMAWDLIEDGKACGGLKGIVVSGHGMAEHIERSRKAGFKEHLVKPFRIEQLRAAIRRAVG